MLIQVQIIIRGGLLFHVPFINLTETVGMMLSAMRPIEAIGHFVPFHHQLARIVLWERSLYPRLEH